MQPLEPTGMAGRTFGERFVVRADLGSSAVADSFVAVDLDDGRLVALKIFDQAIGEDPTVADRLADVLGQTATLRHPGIVPTIDWGIDGVRVWVASELARGGSLRSILERGETVTASQALVMGLECTRALTYLHDQGIVHGGIRPENMCFSADQRLVLADVGLRDALADYVVTRPSLAVAQVAYDSPEQARQRSLDGRSDVYSLALVLNEAVTGEAPPTGDTAIATRASRGGTSAAVAADLGPLRPALERCGRIEAHERPDAGELSIALLAAAEQMARPGPLPLTGVLISASLLAEEAETVAARQPAEPATAPLDVPNPAPGPDADLAAEVTASPQPADGAGAVGAAAVDAAAVDAEAVGAGAVGPDDRPVLAAVPDLAHEPPSLRDLDAVVPVFAEPEADEPAFDVPSAPAAAPASSFEADVEDLDSDLPRWPVGVLALLVAAAVAAAVLLAGFGMPGNDDLPQVVGLDASAARAAVVDSGWQVEQLEVRSNGTVAGEVVAQNPPAGTALAADQVVTLTVSLGGELIEIPSDLAGLSLDQAQERLRLVELVVGTVTEETNETVEAGLVIAVDEPTRQKAANAAVALRVSAGPEDRTVPDVVGTTLVDATATLAAQRLQVDEQPTFDDEVEPGVVLGSNPTPGAIVPADSQVTLFVSAGPEPVEIPDLSGLELGEATAALGELGLIFTDTEGVPGQPVIGTIPPAGEVVDVGTEVIVVLDESEEGAEDES